MINSEHIANRKMNCHCPPERFHVFVSYTTREAEVQLVKPIVDHFLNNVLRPIIEQSIGEPPAFYDGYSLYNSSGQRFLELDLERAIRFAIEESEVLIAFVSPEYFGSRWCRFECAAMLSKEFRPWFDLCRKPPISELRDKRPSDWRPSGWACMCAKLRMRRWRLRNNTFKPGGAILRVLWKGEADPLMEMSALQRFPSFDWTSCVRAAEAFERVHSHLFHHGSVSPSWEWEAKALKEQCQESMSAAAVAVTKILEQRRQEYASGE